MEIKRDILEKVLTSHFGLTSIEYHNKQGGTYFFIGKAAENKYLDVKIDIFTGDVYQRPFMGNDWEIQGTLVNDEIRTKIVVNCQLECQGLSMSEIESLFRYGSSTLEECMKEGKVFLKGNALIKKEENNRLHFNYFGLQSPIQFQTNLGPIYNAQ